MYAFLQAVGIDPKKIGFTEDLFDRAHSHLYKNLYSGTESGYYAVEEEIFLAFYLAIKRGVKGFVLDQFKKTTLPGLRRKMGGYIREYFGVHKSKNIPPALRDGVVSIYKEELSAVLTEIKKLL